MSNPVTYQIRDLNNEKNIGSFYAQELSTAKQNIFRIEKVIKRDKKYKDLLLNGLNIVICIILEIHMLI